jgi:hypothetical protein
VRGAPYEFALQASGDSPPFKWKKGAALPKGLKLSKTGVLSGVPSPKKLTPGSYPVPVQVSDSKKRTATATLILKVS